MSESGLERSDYQVVLATSFQPPTLIAIFFLVTYSRPHETDPSAD
ncbi:hypothetical protein [Nitrosomonas nitrosa]|nr:hypothetical protein [Nitrosomonas nitrosa]